MIIRKVQQQDDKRIAEIIRGIFDELDMPKEHTVYDDPNTDLYDESVVVIQAR